MELKEWKKAEPVAAIQSFWGTSPTTRKRRRMITDDDVEQQDIGLNQLPGGVP